MKTVKANGACGRLVSRLAKGALLGIVLAPTQSWATTVYLVTDLGPGAAYGINDLNDVVGVQPAGAFLYSAGTTTLFMAGTYSSLARAINNNREMTGVYQATISASPHAFKATLNGYVDLGLLSTGVGTSGGYGINLYGVVAGASDRPNAIPRVPGHAVYSSGTGWVDMGTLGGTASEAFGISSTGAVVGDSNTTMGVPHGYLWKMGVMQDLGTLGGFGISSAWGINDYEVVTGGSMISNGNMHAFRYQSPTITDLGVVQGWVSSFGESINNSGQVVGLCTSTQSAIPHGNSSTIGFVTSGGSMVNLNAVSALPQGMSIIDATCINNQGAIAAVGMIGGVSHALLLTPI